MARFGCITGFLVATLAYSQAPPPAAPGTPQIRTGTQLVILDVVVQDSAGHSVRSLPRDAFRVTESKAPQNVSAFEEHSTANPPRPGPQIPKMPAGTFTDYTPVPPGTTLNVLLVDALNTPMQDQAYLRDQLKAYVNKAQPGTQVAIFGLNTRLFLLQGFTSNLDTLKDAVNHKLVPRGSHLMDDPIAGSAASPESELADMAEDLGAPEVSANLRQFEAVEQSSKLQLRLQYTLDAFNSLAHYLSAFPGRKNLLWFSGAFPINILPDATLQDPFAVVQVNGEEFRDTTSLLSRSQVAVYPIDARGLMTAPMLNASNSGAQYARNPGRLNTDLAKFNSSQADEHSTMDQMASETGGHAFYNTNGLADAVAAALDSGANYYTLAYSPNDRNPHGEYRPLHVELTGASAAAGYKLSYRRGYFADKAQPAKPQPAKSQPAPHSADAATPAGSPQPAPGAPSSTPAQVASTAYSRAALLHGAPTPQDILFKVRVLPVSPATDAALTPEDHADPAGAFKGPYRRYAIDFAALGRDFRLTLEPDGTHKGAVEFSTFVYDADGRLLNVNTKRINMNLTPENYKRVSTSGLGMHLQVSAPARGESYLRIAVHDVVSTRFGVVEIPTAGVSRLPPLPPDPAAPPASAPPAAPTNPSVPQ